MPTQLHFDRGTLIIDGPHARGVAGVVFDERTQNLRASAHRYRTIRAKLVEAGEHVDDPLVERWRRHSTAWLPSALRPYQRDALTAWLRSKRGTIVLPTGAGKTRVALAAAAALRVPTAILCPTRVLLGQWLAALKAVHSETIGVLGDGETSISDVTVMTFESAYRRMDALGDRFALVIVDEVHHFASGLRGEALEACAAPFRLGLTATAPDVGSEGEAVLADLVGPTVFAMSIGDLTGAHLAEFDVVRLRVALDPSERSEYARLARPFLELKHDLRQVDPNLDWEATLRAMSRTSAGRSAVRGWQRAIALASFPAEKRRLASSLIAKHRQDKTLVFAALAAEARLVSCDSLVPAITAEISRQEREEILTRFRDGRFGCIVSARVLNEGVDVPDANVAILLGGALGVREQIQRVGRVLRPSPGKRAVVYDIATAHTIDAERSDRKWRRLAAQSLPTVPA
jgi:superfamily II DNA or RNA helicase